MSTKSAEALDRKRHLKFEDTAFERVIAHSGSDFILTRRGLESRNTGINFIDLTIVPVASSIGIHTHQNDNAEIYVIISGQGEMKLDHSEFPVGPGDVVVNRPGGTHGLRNSGDTELRLVVIEFPVPGLNNTVPGGNAES
jgi:mannose-6-phosphate isomerase-like protein (cupin superfamily)